MKINKTVFVEKIFKGQFNSNYSKCAHALNVEPQQLHRFINNANSEAGAKLLGGFYLYCRDHGLVFDDYIILPINQTAVELLTGTAS